MVPFYLSTRTRPSPRLNRDAPSVIQARIRAVTSTVTITTIATTYILTQVGNLSWSASLHHLGIWPISPVVILKTSTLTFILFLGPLYADIVLDGSLLPPSKAWSDIVTSLSSSMGYRNYVVGPVTEELLFRSCLIPLHLLSPWADSPKKLVFLTPLYFGIAHVHHFYEFRLSHPDTPRLQAILRTIFQFGFTTVFGWYTSYIFLRTGNVYAVILIHTFCNYMGFPKLWGKMRLQQSSKHSIKRSEVFKRTKDDDSAKLTSSLLNVDAELTHTVIYYALLITGVTLFSQLLVPLSDAGSLAPIDFDRTKSH